MEKSWKEFVVEGWAGYIKFNLKKWNKMVFGDVSSKLKAAEDEVNKLDLLEEGRELIESEKLRRKEVINDVWRLSMMVEWMWLQKARLDWSLKGDRNTRYFHVMASRNGIHSITVGDFVYEDPGRVKHEVFLYFNKHFIEEWRSRPTLGGSFKSVSNNNASMGLEVEFSELEVWNAINSCEGNKALGPDGFNLVCFQKYWKIMKGEVMQFMKEFHANGRLVRGVNSSFITLAPEKS